MDKKAFIDYLEKNAGRFSCRETVCRDHTGLEVGNSTHGTRTFFSDEAIAAGELNQLLAATNQGRNIEHITRVTGYFSKVRSWNQGKVAELIDRRRTPVGAAEGAPAGDST